MKRSEVSDNVVLFDACEMYLWRIVFEEPHEGDDDDEEAEQYDVNVIANNHGFAVEAATIAVTGSEVTKPVLRVISVRRIRQVQAAYIPRPRKKDTE